MHPAIGASVGRVCAVLLLAGQTGKGIKSSLHHVFPFRRIKLVAEKDQRKERFQILLKKVKAQFLPAIGIGAQGFRHDLVALRDERDTAMPGRVDAPHAWSKLCDVHWHAPGRDRRGFCV